MSPERRKLIRIFLGVQLFLGIGALIGQINFHLTEGTSRDRLYFVPYLIGFAIASFIFPFFPAYRKAKFQGGGDLYVPLTFILGILIFPIFVIESYKPFFEKVPIVTSVSEINNLPNPYFRINNLRPGTNRIEDAVRYSYKENKKEKYAGYNHRFNYEALVPLAAPMDSSQRIYFSTDDLLVKKGDFTESTIERIADSLRYALRKQLLKYPFDSIQYFKKVEAPDFYTQKPGEVFVKASLEPYWSDQYPTIIFLAVLWLITFMMYWFSVRFGDSAFDSG